MRTKSAFIWLWIFILLIGCTPAVEDVEPTAVSTTSQSQPTAITTLVSTATAVPTTQPAPTPTATPITIPLPAWLSDPATPVVVSAIKAGIYDETLHLHFLNLETGEAFELPLAEGRRDLVYQWETNTLFSYWQSIPDTDPKAWEHTALDLTTGIIIQKLEDAPMKDRRLSPDGQHLARMEWISPWDVEEGEPFGMQMLHIEDVNGNIVTLDDPVEPEFDNDRPDLKWSPDGRYLMVIHRHQDNPDVYEFCTITTFFTNQGELVGSYDGLHGDWATDGSSRVQYRSFGEICWFDVAVGSETSCNGASSRWADERGYTTDKYQLSPDGTRLSFIYWRTPPALLDGFDSGVCFVQLSDDAVVCPTDAVADTFPEANGPYLLEANWSPNGEFLQILVDPGGLSSSDRTMMAMAVIAADGSNFFWLGPAYWGDSVAKWRP
ncbi:hypothetical protein [Candidatus Leptofilum sp.]|uniref:hypothetical protein n=1 Tax=Candidatus Leptofilum sp. TaxID=3241576 RepID=UPI003B59261A